MPTKVGPVVDLEKAYDRLRWDFIEDTLGGVGFDEHFIHIIMKCISLAKMKIMWNGSLSEEFNMERGIRQGDSLSPYIFVLCMERLSHIINDSIESKHWRPIKVSRGGPQISHLFFADDLLLFVEASCNQMRVINDCLANFWKYSGAKVSVEKTRLFCSKNMNHMVKQDISSVSGFMLIGDLGKYLGRACRED